MRLRPAFGVRVTMEAGVADGEKTPETTVLVDGATMYLKMADFAELNGGKPWTKASLKDLSKKDREALLGDTEGESPARLTKMITASKAVREAGTETVGGVVARHVTATVPVTDALAALDSDDRAETRKDYAEIGATSVTFDAWIGPDDLPRRIVQRVATPTGPMVETVDYSGYGAPVDLTPPPAAQVGTLAEGFGL